ncbi:PREDICTED: CD44 antigen isoform X14 [Corvus brachyrhynchos]|uniref:CD44 antigen isoform X14 n=1 Tax=Corvus brachyrhynchos TaxID=85066 RepID=UPI00081638F3|nr:PREDICTED: CD44 antigen isoform X14 [Corvus brachyrhynchos]
MANFSLWATFGLCLLKLCLTETEFNVSCRYRGVFHVEKNGRYSLTRSEAVKLCRALNSTLATLEQLKEAHESGFETCRYGFVVGHIVIPRIKPYPLCAANTTGIYKLPANTTDRYDAYCYNASETEEKACEPIKTIDTSLLSNQDETVIDNADGSRYNPDGSRHTSGESSTSGVDDENAGSGSTHETTPMDTSIRRSSPSYYGSPTPVSQLPDHTFGGGEKGIPEKDYGDEFTSMSPHISLGTVAGDFHEEDDRQYPASTTMVPSHGAKQNDSEQDPLVYPGWDKGKDYATQPAITDRVIPSTENNHERESSTTAVASPDGAYHKDPTQPFLPSDNASEKSTEGITNPTDAPWDEVLHRTTASMTETVTASTDVLAPEDITLEAWAPHLVVTVASSPDGAHHKEPTQTPLPSDDEPGQGTEGTTIPTDTLRDEVLHRTTASMTKTGNDSPLMGTIVESVDDVDQEKATKEPLAPGTTPGREGEEANTTDGSPVHGKPGVFSDIEDRFIPLQTPLTTSSTSSVYVSQGPHKGHYESTTSLEETATTKIASPPRLARVPDWLIIVVALVVLALILAVCIAVNSRRRCGQKKKLVINNGKGAVEDRKTSELNGDVSKSQEMVHLVHKEQSNDRTQACDEFLTVNETQNHHEFDMKTGV